MNRVNVTLIVLFLSLAFAADCAQELPTLDLVYSDYFKTNSYVTAGSYVRFYYNAPAGSTFTVTMTSSSKSLEFVGSRTEYSKYPTTGDREYYAFSSTDSSSTFVITPTSTECFAFGAYGSNGNSGYFTIEISNGTIGYPGADFADEEPICGKILPDNATYTELISGSSYRKTQNVLAGEVQMFYYSAFAHQLISVILDKDSSSETDPDPSLVASDAFYILTPTTEANEYQNNGDSRTYFSTFSVRKCFAIAVRASRDGSYEMKIYSSANNISPPFALIIGLSIGLPVLFCCLFGFAVRLYCIRIRRRREALKYQAVAAHPNIPIGRRAEEEEEIGEPDDQQGPGAEDAVPPAAQI